MFLLNKTILQTPLSSLLINPNPITIKQ
jgi:hypothetical protein